MVYLDRKKKDSELGDRDYAFQRIEKKKRMEKENEESQKNVGHRLAALTYT